MLNCKKNASRTANSRSAFTLIELSIVLIIIGLLVAGITGGAALINAAKLRSVMTDANANKIAANNFYSQYATYQVILIKQLVHWCWLMGIRMD